MNPSSRLSRFNSLLSEQRNNKQLLVILGIITVALLTSASIFATGPNALPQENAEKAWPVSVVPAIPGTMRPSFAAFGKVESQRIARLRSDLVARVETVYVREGEWVDADQILVQLDDRETHLRLLERQAELKQHEAALISMRSRLTLEQQSTEHYQSRFRVAQDKLKRHEDLMRKRLISKSLLDEVTSQANEASIEYRNHERQLINLPNDIAANEAHVAKAEALLAQARLDLDKTRITAPFAGPVMNVLAAPGDYTNLSAPLVEMADAGAFEVRVQVPDTYNQLIQAAIDSGSAVAANTVDGARLPMTRLANHVRAGQTGTDAFFAIDESARRTLPLGQVLNLSVELPEQPGLVAVPVQSIYENGRVFTVAENRLVAHTVLRVGERETPEEGYQILIRAEDIAEGAPIIATQLPRAINGLLVQVAN